MMMMIPYLFIKSWGEERGGIDGIEIAWEVLWRVHMMRERFQPAW